MFCSLVSEAQLPRRLGNIGRSLGNGGQKTDSLKHRSKSEDSITVNFRYLDSSRNYKLDSSVSDYTKFFPIPATNLFLGNDGAASESLLFSPTMKAGWDEGLHGYDIYKFKMEKVRFFNTTRPYSELNYLIGGRAEQIIEVFHTQNRNPNWNFSFNYRLIGTPGYFKNQKAGHNNYLLTNWYNTKNKRYNNYFVVLANVIKAGENGGFSATGDYLSNPDYKDRSLIPVRLGGDQAYSANFLKTSIITGNQYSDVTLLMRQQYDLGRKDSIVTDSSVVPLFYPRLRFEHTFSYSKYKYEFHDDYSSGINQPDSSYYQNFYNYNIHPGDTVTFRDSWNEIVNDFSIIQFPDANNLQQFIRVGASLQNLKGTFSTGTRSLYNAILHGEYRNRTRDRKWDIEANGKFYLGGFNAGDYQAHVSLQRLIGKNLGYLQLGFENVNRSPSFIYNTSSSFYLDTVKNFNKENITHFFASYDNPKLKLRLTGDYYLISNYMYVTEYYKLKQESTLFNFLQLSLQRTTRIGRHWYWYADLYLQQKAGDVNLNVPLFFTRNRLAFEGVFYKNLNISTGVELRYNTPYKADGYSPVLGQFMFQDSSTIKNRPDIRLFLNFRIRSFKLFISAANLNSVTTSSGFSFKRNNVPAPDYVYPGLQLRFGIYWSFVN